MKRKPVLIALLSIAVLALLVGGFFATFVRKQVTERVAAHGEARSNRFFALQLILQRLHEPVRALTTLDPRQLPLLPGDTLLLGDGAARVNAADAARITAWVRRGGHLLLSPGSTAAMAQAPLFKALGLRDPHPAAFACSALDAAHEADGKDRLCGSRFRLDAAAAARVDASIGDATNGYLFARSALGRGEVSLLASFDVITGKHLQQAAAQHFAWRLLAPNLHQGRIYLVYALDGISLPKLLLLRGWPALLALTVLLAGWMAMRSARLGPLMPAPTLHRRALLDHVQAAGEFLYRRDAGRSLHALARDAVLARLRRRDPACAVLNGEALYARLAERSHFDAAQIAQAFQSPANAQAFRACISTLARLRSRP